MDHKAPRSTPITHKMENGVVLISDQPEFLAHSVDGNVGDVDAVQESEEEQQEEDGNFLSGTPFHGWCRRGTVVCLRSKAYGTAL